MTICNFRQWCSSWDKGLGLKAPRGQKNSLNLGLGPEKKRVWDLVLRFRPSFSWSRILSPLPDAIARLRQGSATSNTRSSCNSSRLHDGERVITTDTQNTNRHLRVIVIVPKTVRRGVRSLSVHGRLSVRQSSDQVWRLELTLCEAGPATAASDS